MYFKTLFHHIVRIIAKTNNWKERGFVITLNLSWLLNYHKICLFFIVNFCYVCLLSGQDLNSELKTGLGFKSGMGQDKKEKIGKLKFIQGKIT